MLVELLARDAGLDYAIEVLGMHGEYAIHVAEIEADATKGRIDLAFERGAGAKRNHRHALGRAQPHDLLHFFGILREDHRVRRLIADPGERVAVLLADRLRCH